MSQLVSTPLTIAETVPDNLEFLTAYQEQAYKQIVWDNPDDAHTIRELQPKAYMFRGLQEEMEEIAGEDRVEPGYSRMAALLLAGELLPFDAASQTETAVARHTKEFGDVSWYLTNYLTLFGLTAAHAVRAGQAAWELDRVSAPRGSASFVLDLEARFPWAFLFEAQVELSAAANDILNVRRDDRQQYEKRLLIASGKVITSMMHLSVVRFDRTYEAVLTQNQKKLTKRIAEQTVFDKTGGDDR